MSKRAIFALVLFVASSNVFASYYEDGYEDQDDVREYIVRERHLNDWNDDEHIEYRRYERSHTSGWGTHHWGPPGHARRVFRDNCPPPQRAFRGRFIERVQSPHFDFRIRFQNY